MNVVDLRELLDRASNRIDPPLLLAERTLHEARRRRTRRRGVASALAAAGAVVVVIASVRLVAGDPASEVPPADPVPPTATEVRLAPPVPDSRVQSAWDPRDVDALPAVDLGVPRVLSTSVTGSSPVAEAVALLDGDRPLLVAGDGTTAVLDLPAGIGRWRTLALSPDGRRVAALGRALFWREVEGGAWQRTDRPGGVDIDAGVRWLSARAVVLSGHRSGVRIDLDSGDRRRLDFARSTSAWAPVSGERYVAHADPGVRALRELAGDQEVARTNLGPLGGLQRFVVRGQAIAAVRTSTTFSPESPAEADGLIALERGTLETRAFLPIPDERSWYADGGALTPLTWLGGETVLFTIVPEGSAAEFLVAWDVGTGALSRVSTWPAAYDVTLATGRIAR